MTTEHSIFWKSIVRKALAEYREAYAQWEANCEEDHANGYRAHYCLHGVSRWTDYDNICGYCEEGFTDEKWIYYGALSLAKQREEKLLDILDMFNKVNKGGFTENLKKAIWAEFDEFCKVAVSGPSKRNLVNI